MRTFFFLLAFLANVVFVQANAPSSEEVYEFKGVHFLASYMDCDLDALTNLPALASAMEEAAVASGASILKTSSHVFPPVGFTMVILLSESHASIHTYPEVGACFIDLFTCGTKCSSERFDEVLRAYLKPKTVCQKQLIRDQSLSEK